MVTSSRKIYGFGAFGSLDARELEPKPFPVHDEAVAQQLVGVGSPCVVPVQGAPRSDLEISQVPSFGRDWHVRAWQVSQIRTRTPKLCPEIKALQSPVLWFSSLRFSVSVIRTKNQDFKAASPDPFQNAQFWYYFEVYCNC